MISVRRQKAKKNRFAILNQESLITRNKLTKRIKRALKLHRDVNEQ